MTHEPLTSAICVDAQQGYLDSYVCTCNGDVAGRYVLYRALVIRFCTLVLYGIGTKSFQGSWKNHRKVSCLLLVGGSVVLST